jgi:hypothetical protein
MPVTSLIGVRAGAVLLGLTLLTGLTACGGSSSPANEQAQPAESSTTESTTASTTAGTSGDALDPDAINPCVLEPAEVKTLNELNPESLGGFDASYGPGVVVDPSGYPTCNYEVLFAEDDGMPSSYFSVGVDARPNTTCFVEHRGLCVFPVTTYGDVEPAAYVVPESIVQAVEARLDAQ